MKNMMSIAYSMRAVMDPICMAHAPTRSAPTHRMSDSAPFMRKNVIESAVANMRFTRMAFSAYSSNVSSRRLAAARSRPNARMGRTPPIVSRRRTFMRSTKPCRRVNTGAERRTATTDTASMQATTARSTTPIHASTENARTTEMTQMTGTGSTMSEHMSRACCTTLASDRVRVTIEPVPKRSKSEPEKASEAS